MHVIYSHPKAHFKGILGIGKAETFAFSLIIVLMAFAAKNQLEFINAGFKGTLQVDPAEVLYMTLTTISLYFLGRISMMIVVKRANTRMNEQINAACSTVKEKTGVEINHLEMSKLIELAVVVEPQTHTEKVGDTEYSLHVSAEHDNLTVSYSAIVQHKTAKVSARIVLGSGLA